jgi:hypothetical protein
LQPFALTFSLTFSKPLSTALCLLPESAAQSFIGKHQLRKTADPGVGNFLRKLANVRSSRNLFYATTKRSCTWFG